MGMNIDEDESDHDDIQEQVFEGYDDDNNINTNNIRKISEFINMLNGANKLELKSFKNKDKLLLNKQLLLSDDNKDNKDDSKKYFNLLSKHFEIRQQRLIKLKKSSSNVLENSIIQRQ